MSERTHVFMPDGDRVIVWADENKNRVGYRVEGMPPTHMSPAQAERQVAQMRQGAKESPMSPEEADALTQVADAIETSKEQL